MVPGSPEQLEQAVRSLMELVDARYLQLAARQTVESLVRPDQPLEELLGLLARHPLEEQQLAGVVRGGRRGKGCGGAADALPQCGARGGRVPSRQATSERSVSPHMLAASLRSHFCWSCGTLCGPHWGPLCSTHSR
jgi:hypothetical protein